MIDLDKNFAFYETALRGIATRQQVTAHNIANQNTPGYRSREVRFEAILEEALRSGHRSADFTASVVGNLPLKANGNDVDIEREWMLMEANKLTHEVFSRAAGSSLRGLMNAIRSR